MLGRKTYTRDELEQARATIRRRVSAYEALADAAGANGAASALDAFEPAFFNDLAVVLDRYFVHRLRMVAGKDTNPLNELELLADSLLNNGGVLRTNNAVKYVPGESVLQLEIGDRIELTAGDFKRLSSAFFRELEDRFV